MTGITIQDRGGGVVGTSFNSLEWFMTGITIRDKGGGEHPLTHWSGL